MRIWRRLILTWRKGIYVFNHRILYLYPFAWLVRFFYELTSSYGAAIILFTLVIKLIMLPFQMKSKKSMLRMNRMSGKIQEIRKNTPTTS